MAEKTTLARPYAKALFDHASAENQLNEWSKVLSVFACLFADRDINNFLASPLVALDKKIKLLVDILAFDNEETLKNFIRLLDHNKRLMLLPTIAQLFELLMADYKKTIEVTVTTFANLTDTQKKQLTEVLAKKLQSEVILQIQINPNILGGAIIQAGDLIIDGSVKGKLTKLAESLAA